MESRGSPTHPPTYLGHAPPHIHPTTTGGRASAQSSSDDLNASGSGAGDLRPNQLLLREGLIWDPNALPAEDGALRVRVLLGCWEDN